MSLPFDVESLLSGSKEKAFDLHTKHINPAFVKVLRTIGFDVNYVKGVGQYLWDDTGNKYLDFLSGYGVFAVGRNNPQIRQALIQAMNLDLPNLIKMDAPLLAGMLAEKLVQKCPSKCDSVFFANSGTEVVEAAMKFARAATGREGFLYLGRAYHGLTMGSLTINGCTHFREGFGELYPSCAVDMGNLTQLEDALKTKKYAAFFIEPVQGKGVYFPTDDYFIRAQELCKKYGTLLVADEIQSGMGRTGKFFAYEHWNLEPDMVLVSKTLSGGFVPVSAVILPREIHKKTFSSMERSVVHSTTFSQNDLAMVAGLATLDYIEKENLVERAEKMGNLLMTECRKFIGKYELLKEVRGKGLMIGFEFGKPQSLKLSLGWKLVNTADKGLFGQLIVIPLFTKHRILTQVAGHQVNIVKILPSLVITEEDVMHFVNSFEDVLKEVHAFPGAIWEVGSKLAKATVAQNLGRGAAL